MNAAEATSGPTTVRLTTAQALVRFLAAQVSERDGVEHRLIEGCFGIFGHGNLAGVGQALEEATDLLPFHPGHNEQAMVHAAVGYARTRHRLSTLACTTSVGPGATNTITAAAGATINRLPVLLLLGDTFASRSAEPVLQQLEHPEAGDVTVNDCLRPVSRYFDRITRPAQLLSSLPRAMGVLTDPAATGTVTIALPQDVQTEAFDFPSAFFDRRVWHVARQPADPAAVAAAAAAIRGASRPLIVAGGGVRYSEAGAALSAFAERCGIPVAETQAGKGAIGAHPLVVGGVGATGTPVANALAREADLVIGLGTRWTDFTTASHTVFADPDVRFVNVNVCAPDAAKHSAVSLVADARAGIAQLDAALGDHRVSDAYRDEVRSLTDAWTAEVRSLTTVAPASAGAAGLCQRHVLGVLSEELGPDDIVVAAAGSVPGDLHKLWAAAGPDQYQVEYGYSCMGYEIAGALGAKMAAPDRDVFSLVGDGSFLMMSQDLATSVQEGAKLVVILLQSHGYASIGSLSESVGSRRFGTEHRLRGGGGVLPVDLAANARSLGALVVSPTSLDGLADALRDARKAERTVVIHVEIDPSDRLPSYGWWDVPVAEVARDPQVREARARYEAARVEQRPYL